MAAFEKWLVVTTAPLANGCKLPRNSATSLRPTECSQRFACTCTSVFSKTQILPPALAFTSTPPSALNLVTQTVVRGLSVFVGFLENFVFGVAAYLEIASGGYIAAVQDFCHGEPPCKVGGAKSLGPRRVIRQIQFLMRQAKRGDGCPA